MVEIIKKICGPAIINSCIHFSAKIKSGSYVVNSSFDRYSFCGYDCEAVNTEIGSFCSIAHNVVIGGAMHPIEFFETYINENITLLFGRYLCR